MGPKNKTAKNGAASASTAFENKVGLPPKKLQELLDLFHPARDFGDTLIDRLLRYVLDGIEDDAALEELACCKDAAHALQLGCATQTGMGFSQTAWSSFLNTVEPADPILFLR